MRSPRSLQNRLLLSFLVSMTVILAGGGFVIYTVIAKHLASENDAALRDRLAFYETTLRLKLERGEVLAMYRWIPEEIRQAGNAYVVQAWFADTGKVIPHGPPTLIAQPLPRPSVSGDEVLFMDQTFPDGRAARLVTRVFVPVRDEKVPPVKLQILVARDLQAFRKTLSDVRWFLIKIGLAVMGVILIASRRIIRRGVKPIHSLVQQIEVMPLTDEGDRFSLPGAPMELQPVVGRLNALMDRVNAAIEHERQFASNAAHELRNPLAAIRSRIELALSRLRKAEEYEDTLDSILQSQQGMQRVVDHLLLLARLESGHRQSEFISERTVFGKMLKKAWLGCLEIAEQKKLRVSWQVESPETEIVTSLSLASIVFTNIFDNAAHYTPPGGEIRILAAIRDGNCCVAVENTNPGLRDEQLEETFAPFWRADPNASGHRGNAGIGLALCRRIAMTLGGKILASLTAGGMVRYAVELPVTLIRAAAVPPAAPAAS